MSIVKLLCLTLCGMSVFGAVEGVHILRTGDIGSALPHPILRTVFSVALAAFWASALYGVQKRKPIVWKLGWGVVLSGSMLFAAQAGRSILAVRTRPDRAIQFWILEIFTTALCAFWCFWWHRQKTYFVSRREI
ncbi:MAG TPA: hypothetical protein VJS43_00475 [Candidatus Acidoferrales bacterium]|nr:hypothetical protein [Candidatus Acidoferrales bacterium]